MLSMATAIIYMLDPDFKYSSMIRGTANRPANLGFFH